MPFRRAQAWEHGCALYVLSMQTRFSEQGSSWELRNKTNDLASNGMSWHAEYGARPNIQNSDWSTKLFDHRVL